MEERRARIEAVGLCLLAPAYLVLSVLGRELGEIDSLTVWYPPAGLAVAAAMLIGARAIPVLALGELISSILVFDVADDFSPLQLVVNAAGYAAVWGFTGVVLRRWTAGDPRRLLSRVSQSLFVIAVPVPLAAAIFGVAMQRWAGLGAGPFFDDVSVWWTGDAVGAVSLGPSLVILVWSRVRGSIPGYRTFGDQHPVRTALELASPVLTAVAIFAVGAHEVRFPYLIFLPIVLVALRFGIEGAAIATLGLTPVVTLLVDLLQPSSLDRAELQALLLVGLTSGLLVGAVVSDRARLGRMHAELSSVIEATPDLVTIADPHGRITYMNPAARAVIGLGPEDRLDGLSDQGLAPDDLAAEHTALARSAALRDGTWEGDVMIRAADGRDIIGSKLLVSQPSASGRMRTSSIVRDVTEQRRLEQELARGALYDQATGLPNIALLSERIEHALVRGGRKGLLLVTIDRLAVVTESVGHAASAAVVQVAADRMAGQLRAADTLARIGTDTFAVLPEDDLDEVAAITLGDRLIEATSGAVAFAGRDLPLTVRIGAVVTGPEMSTADEMLRAAELAAHRAAEEGHKRPMLHSARMSSHARRQLELESELRSAIAGERWELAYQPIVDVATCETVSCEALLRCTSGDGAALPPYELILLAEETGLIVSLGEAILERACRESIGWSIGGQPLTVAVNVSPRQLLEPGFVQAVCAVFDRTGYDPHRLSVELTETSFVGASANSPFRHLAGIGVQLTMDDFGTGYSSLSQLAGLSLVKAKLDKSFIDDVATSSRCRQLVKSVIDLAHALDVTVVAEGVEHSAQLEVLRDLGCDQAQGYLFSRPVPPDQLSALLASPLVTR